MDDLQVAIERALPSWAGPPVLAIELFALFMVPLVIFLRSRLFPPTVAFQAAGAVAALLYLGLPDPVQVGWLDDALVALLFAAATLPPVRRALVARLAAGVSQPARRRPAAAPEEARGG